MVKERGNLTHDLQKRLPQTERKKGPGRPPMQTGESASSSGQSLPTIQPSTSMAPNLSFPSLASAGLGGLNPSTLLSSLSMGNFDPKNNPLLMPFSGLPNIGALGSMGGLSNINLTNSLFANLAGLSLPGLAGMDPSTMNDNSHTIQSTQSNTKSKSRKSESNSKSTPSSSANVPSSLPGSLPFFFPNPSLLYTPLGLGGLNPFSLQPGAMSSAYDSLSLLNGSLNVSSPNTSQNSLSRHKTSSSRGQSSNASTVTSSSQRQPKTSTHHISTTNQSSTDLLENLTRVGRNLPPPDLSKSRSSRDVDSLRSLMSSIPSFNMLAAGALASNSGDSKKTREQEMRDALENLSKTSPELFGRPLPDDKKFSFPSMEMVEKTLKRPSEQNTSIERPSKRTKDISPITIPVPPTMSKLPHATRDASSESGIDLSGQIRAAKSDKQRDKPKKVVDIPQPSSNVEVECNLHVLDKSDAENIGIIKQKSDTIDENDDKNSSKNRKRCRVKKTSVDENIERKNLRSNAGRAAAAAAARTKSHSPSPPPE